MGFPDIIILDEPTVGLDPKQIIEIRELIRGLAKKHTVILSSHILAEIREVCDEIMIISKGKLVASDTPEKLEEQMAAEGKKYNTNPGGYIWPVDSRYITSTVGGRNSPGGVGSTNHKGTDIGRVGYTSPVYAAKAGTVIIAQRSSSYGNYVVISHGVGNTTLYAHMSSIKVSVGTYVKQGQTIGITGSTGHSTGPHLHFEVVENNVRINPLSHGAAPKKGYLTGYTLSGTSVGK